MQEPKATNDSVSAPVPQTVVPTVVPTVACVDWPAARPILTSMKSNGQELWAAIGNGDRGTVLAAGRAQILAIRNLKETVHNSPIVAIRLDREIAALEAFVGLAEGEANPSYRGLLHNLNRTARKTTAAIDGKLATMPSCP